MEIHLELTFVFDKNRKTLMIQSETSFLTALDEHVRLMGPERD